MDFKLTQKLSLDVNLNYLRFARTEPLELVLFQPDDPPRDRLGLRHRVPLPPVPRPAGPGRGRRVRLRAGTGLQGHLLFQLLDGRLWCEGRAAVSGLRDARAGLLMKRRAASLSLFGALVALTAVVALAGGGGAGAGAASGRQEAPATPAVAPTPAPISGCMSCHTKTDSASAHESAAVRIGCVDCHGGDAGVSVAAGTAPGSSAYEKAKRKAHVLPRDDDFWKSSGNPEISASGWERESAEFVRFVNPGDLRVAREACGTDEVSSQGGQGRLDLDDAARGDAVGIGAVQQRRVSDQERGLRRVLHARRRTGARAAEPGADRRSRRGRKGSCRSSSPSRAGRSRSRATSCASSSGAGSPCRRSGIPTRPRSRRAAPTTSSPSADSARCSAPTPSSWACRRRASWTRRSTSWAPTTIPATTAPRDARRVT